MAKQGDTETPCIYQSTIETLCNLCSRGLRLLPRTLLPLDSTVQNLINNTQLERLIGTHKVIALHKLLNLIKGQLLLASKMALVDLIELSAHTKDLLRMDSDVGRLSEVAARGLVHHDRGVRETVALACFAAGEKEGTH